MRLGVSASTAKDVGHFGSGVRKVVSIDFKLIL